MAAWTYAFIAAVGAVFQIALALGAPWGEMTLGGRYPGRLPTPIRWIAVTQALILTLLAWIVLEAAGKVEGPFESWMVGLPVGISLISAVLNHITKSKKEKKVWGPSTILLVITSSWVAYFA